MMTSIYTVKHVINYMVPFIVILEYMKEATGMFQNTAPFNATGHPALSINGGLSDGLPIGLQLVGKHWDDGTVLRVAYAFEKKRDLVTK